jgi:hypothetical protein
MQSPAKFTTHILLAALGLIVYHQAQAARIEPAGSAFTAQGPGPAPTAPLRSRAKSRPMVHP